MGVNLGARCPPSAPFRARSILAKWGNPVALQVHALAFNRSKNCVFGSVPYCPSPTLRLPLQLPLPVPLTVRAFLAQCPSPLPSPLPSAGPHSPSPLRFPGRPALVQ